MAGFDNDAVDRAFVGRTTIVPNFLIAMGYAESARHRPRGSVYPLRTTTGLSETVRRASRAQGLSAFRGRKAA